MRPPPPDTDKCAPSSGARAERLPAERGLRVGLVCSGWGRLPYRTPKRNISFKIGLDFLLPWLGHTARRAGKLEVCKMGFWLKIHIA